MIVEQATVISYNKGIARVQCQAKAGCGGCKAQASCGTKALSALAGEKIAPQFELEVGQVLESGDQIEIGLSERSLLSSVFWLYGVPLIMVILSSILLSYWIDNELLVVLGMLIITTITFWLIKQKFADQQQLFIPRFLRKI